MQILVRYTLLQLPELAMFVIIMVFVQHWVDLPVWILWGSFAVWVAKDVILYPFVWWAYDQHHEEGANTMIGAQGVAKERMAPSGYVLVRGELWKAELEKGSPPIEKGASVWVRKTRGLTLIVQSASDHPSDRH